LMRGSYDFIANLEPHRRLPWHSGLLRNGPHHRSRR
jgi:hypothetical protein